MIQNQIVLKVTRCFLMTFFTALVLFSICAQAQNKTIVPKSNEVSKVNNIVPSRVPLIIEFENADAEDFLRSVRVKVTNNSNKPIYYLFFDFTPLDVLSPDGEKYSFTMVYGRKQLIQANELAEPDDRPILPGESYVFSVDEKLLRGWAKLREKLNLPLPKLFDFRIQHLNHGDGSGYFGWTGAPYRDRFPKDPKSGKETKNVLMKEPRLKSEGIESPIKQPQSILVNPPVKSGGTSKTCRRSNSVKVTAFFSGINDFSLYNFVFDSINLIVPSANAAPLECGCNGADCGFRKPSEAVCCPLDDSGSEQTYTYIPYWEPASCEDTAGFCSKPITSHNPFLCEGSSGTDYSCYGYYLEYCGFDDCGTEICGNSLDDDCDGFIDNGCPTGGGGGGGCTPYYWVYYISYDGGHTWQIDHIEYVGCW